MKVISYVSIAVVAVLVAACGNAAAPVAISNKPVSVNGIRQPGVPPKPVEQMSWTLADGPEQKLGELQGRVVILDFWATYCAPCRDEIPHLNALQARYGADQLQIIGLNVGGEEDHPKIPAFAQEMKIAYPIAYPEQLLVSYIFENETAIPQTAVFDRQGRLVRKFIGFNEDIKAAIDRTVETTISQN